MNEYWLFYGSSFYEPSSGLGDLKARRKSRAEALAALPPLEIDDEYADHDDTMALYWAKVYEVTPGSERLVASFDDGEWSLY